MLACVQNIITHSHAYSLFPRATFERRITVKTPYQHRENSKHENARRKWEQRGWKVVDLPSALDFLQGATGEFRAMRRYVGDSACWIVPLEPRDPQTQPGMDIPMSLDDDYTRSNAWENRMKVDLPEKFYFDFMDPSTIRAGSNGP
jgi:hypothetical protein